MDTMLKSQAFRKLGFSKTETEKVVEKLNLLLANYHLHYQKLRNFHWNVQGSDFFDMHEQFEDLYELAKNNIDDIAERIRVFGHTPWSNYSIYLDKSEIEESSPDTKAHDMVREILHDFQMLLSFMVEADDAAQEIGDFGTIDMMNNFVKGLEKYHWMLTAFVEAKHAS